MAKRTIKFSLSPESINNALDQLEVYKEQFEAKKHMMMEVIVARGVQIVKEELEALVYSQEGQEYRTNALLESIQGEYDPQTNTGRIWTDNYYAPFVEFGTGIIGANQSHPEWDRYGWNYDVNSHGITGWVYLNDRTGRLQHTLGYRSRPFMYNSRKRLESEIPKIVKEVFGR
jgi:hypothetical protein